MPNNCQNNLIISGESNTLHLFYTAITQNLKEGNKFQILDNLYPCPKDMDNSRYDWNCEHYGTKWSEYEGWINSHGDNQLDLSFSTAWCPIKEGIVHVSAHYPTLTFLYSYHEGGMAFCGVYAIRNGEVIVEKEGVYPSIRFTDDSDTDAVYDAHDTALDSEMTSLTTWAVRTLNNLDVPRGTFTHV